MLEFKEIDQELLSEELKLEENAITSASQNRPSTDDTDLDTPQQSIVQFFLSKLVSLREQALSRLEYFQRRRTEIEQSIQSKDVKAIPAEAEMEAQRVQKKRWSALVELRKGERKMLRNRSAFIATNRLNREPHYPESNTLHWAIIISAVVLESFLNSYFFSKGSELGLLGGAFQALIISLANIGTALVTGIAVFPNFNHVKKTKRRIAAGFSGIYFLVMITFNLASAHYRVLLEVDPFTAMVKAIPHLIRNPLNIDNFDAWVLFIIGLIFVIVALAKGYTFDDQYPGYGKVDRLYVAAKEKYEEAKGQFIDEINSIFIAKAGEVKATVSSINREHVEYLKLLEQSENLVAEFNQKAAYLEHTCNTCLGRYRDVNARVRNSEAPGYFKKKFAFDTEQRTLTLDLTKEKQLSEVLKKVREEAAAAGVNAQEAIREANKKLLERINNFFIEIEKEADRRMVEEVSHL